MRHATTELDGEEEQIITIMYNTTTQPMVITKSGKTEARRRTVFLYPLKVVGQEWIISFSVKQASFGRGTVDFLGTSILYDEMFE